MARIINGELVLKWGIEDVLDRAEDQEIDITEQQAKDILVAMGCNYDCNYGITWETIDYFLADYEVK